MVEEGFWFDPLVFGKRLRHYRRMRGLTLAQLGDRVGKQASFLSMLEGGKREPRPALVEQLAQALDVRSADLLRADPPDKRSRLEVALERAQTEPLYERLHLPPLKASAGPPRRRPGAPGRPLRRAEAGLRPLHPHHPGGPPGHGGAAGGGAQAGTTTSPRSRRWPPRPCAAVGYPGSGAVAQRTLTDLATHFGFTIQQVRDVPASARAITDLRDRRIYIRQRDVLRTREARSVILQTLGHFALGHPDPEDYTTYLRQRIEANYFAGAVLDPRAGRPHPAGGGHGRRRPLGGGRQGGLLRLLRDGRPPLLQPGHPRPRHAGALRALRRPGHHLEGLRERRRALPHRPRRRHRGRAPLPGVGHPRRCSTARTSSPSTTSTPTTPNGEFWCATHVEADRQPYHAVTVGCEADDASHFRGGDTERRSVSRCPDGPCCRRPDRRLAARWDGWAWAAPISHSHAVAVTAGVPGTDTAEVYEFLERYARRGEAGGGGAERQGSRCVLPSPLRPPVGGLRPLPPAAGEADAPCPVGPEVESGLSLPRGDGGGAPAAEGEAVVPYQRPCPPPMAYGLRYGHGAQAGPGATR